MPILSQKIFLLIIVADNIIVIFALLKIKSCEYFETSIDLNSYLLLPLLFKETFNTQFFSSNKPINLFTLHKCLSIISYLFNAFLKVSLIFTLSSIILFNCSLYFVR